MPKPETTRTKSEPSSRKPIKEKATRRTGERSGDFVPPFSAGPRDPEQNRATNAASKPPPTAVATSTGNSRLNRHKLPRSSIPCPRWSMTRTSPARPTNRPRAIQSPSATQLPRPSFRVSVMPSRAQSRIRSRATPLLGAPACGPRLSEFKPRPLIPFDSFSTRTPALQKFSRGEGSFSCPLSRLYC